MSFFLSFFLHSHNHFIFLSSHLLPYFLDTAVKRLMREAMELHEPTDQYFAQPVEVRAFLYNALLCNPCCKSYLDPALFPTEVFI